MNLALIYPVSELIIQIQWCSASSDLKVKQFGSETKSMVKINNERHKQKHNAMHFMTSSSGKRSCTDTKKQEKCSSAKRMN